LPAGFEIPCGTKRFFVDKRAIFLLNAQATSFPTRRVGFFYPEAPLKISRLMPSGMSALNHLPVLFF
jgi:hypothetical protein